MKKLIFLSLNVIFIIFIFFFMGYKIQNTTFTSPFKLYINEVMASNRATHVDSFGRYPDWIELYNASNRDVLLTNYYLSDDGNDLKKWRFPGKVTIPANGFLLIYASDRNQTDSQNQVHTNFSIDANGETIYLTSPDGHTIIDSVEVIRVTTDQSYGRYPDGFDTFKTFYLNSATPNESNVMKQVTSPIFSAVGGFYQNQFKLSIDSEPGSTIYYTLDGSVPTKDSNLYEGEIWIKSRKGEPNYLSNIQTSRIEWQGPPQSEVFKGTVVRAIAIKNGQTSEVVTHTYFIDPNIKEEFQIPVISISTNYDNLFDETTGLFISDNSLEKGAEWERTGHIEFFDENNTLGFSQDIGFRIHGGYTRYAPIKSLRIYAKDNQGYFNYQLFPDKDIDIFNSFLLRNGGSSWINVPFRDAFSQSLIKDVTNVDIQYSRPTIVFINGEYWGLYNIRDRFDVDYIYNHYGTSEIDMLSDLGDIIDYGSDEDYFKLLQILGADLNYGMNYEYVKQKLDVNNFMDYHIAQIYFMNIDQPGKNVKFWRTTKPIDSGYEQTDGRWRYMLFDTDMGFSYDVYANYDRNGLVYTTGLDYFGSTEIHPASDWPSFAPNNQLATFPLRAILKSDEFRTSFINRFADLLNTAFDESLVIQKLDQMTEEIKPYMPDHINRWRMPVSMNKWESDLNNMKTFAKLRPIYMRQHIIDYFHLSGMSSITTTTETEKGFIQINSIEIKDGTPSVTNPSHWTGLYFNDTPIHITAKPNEGYQFKMWLSNDPNINGQTDDTLTVSLTNDLNLTALYEQGSEVMNPIENESPTNYKPALYSIIGSLTLLTSVVIGYVTMTHYKNRG